MTNKAAQVRIKATWVWKDNLEEERSKLRGGKSNLRVGGALVRTGKKPNSEQLELKKVSKETH